MSTMTLTSPDIAPGGPIAMEQVADTFGCAGGNISPELNWSGAPEGTLSYALLCHDPDAPTGGAGFWHWIVYDIPGAAVGLAKGAGAAGGAMLPAGAKMVANDYGSESYGGPCPPQGHGPHRYNFTLYALPVAELGADGAPSKAVVGFMINANAIAKAELQGVFESK